MLAICGIGDWPHRRRVKAAGVAALILGDEELTYDELADRVDRLAVALAGRGVRKGDRVAYLGNNHPAFVETLCAVTLLGAIFVPLNTRLSVPELAYMLENSGARMLFFGAGLEERARAAAGEAGGIEVWGVSVAGPGGVESPLAGGSMTHPACQGFLDDPAVIVYTSGTTGRPKGAVLTHGNLTWNAFNVLVDYDITGETRALMISPLFHVASLGMGLLPNLLKGGTVVLAEKFVPGEALRLIERHRITRLNGVPTTYQLLMEDAAWAETDLSSLRSMSCGGSSVPARVREAYEARGLAFSSGYGLTETSPGATSLSPRYSVSKGESSGLPHFFTEVRLEAQSGEIEVRGPNVFAGYWENPEATEAAFTPDGWLRTGDLGRFDEDGFLTIVDRAQDLIISGGENVYPAEVELAIMTIPEVTGAAVIGLPDPRWGEVPHAVLTLRPGTTLDPAWFVEYLSGRLARYKVPRTFQVVDELPRTASGKVQKHLLRPPDGAPTGVKTVRKDPLVQQRGSRALLPVGVDLELLHPVAQRAVDGCDQALHDLLVGPVVHPHPLQVAQRLLHRVDPVDLFMAQPAGGQAHRGGVSLRAVVGEQVDQLGGRGERPLRGGVDGRGVGDRDPLRAPSEARRTHRTGTQSPLGPAPAQVPPGAGTHHDGDACHDQKEGNQPRDGFQHGAVSGARPLHQLRRSAERAPPCIKRSRAGSRSPCLVLTHSYSRPPYSTKPGTGQPLEVDWWVQWTPTRPGSRYSCPRTMTCAPG